MTFERFISQRISKSKNQNGKIANSVVKIATGAVTLGVAVMLISLSVVKGFKQEVFNRIIGFQSHITVTNRDLNLSFETSPVLYDTALVEQIRSTPNVSHVQTYATKPVIAKSGNTIQGIILKGVDADFDKQYFNKMLKSGRIFSPDASTTGTDSLLISEKLAHLLLKKVGDTLDVYSVTSGTDVRNMLRARRFIISGLYSTGLDEADTHLALCKIGHIQKLYNWDKNQVSGFEITVREFDKLEQTTEEIRNRLAFTFTKDLSLLSVNNFQENNPQIMDWLSLSDMNITIIIVLMSFVAIFQMIAGMLVLILERTQMIGILKTLGANNASVRRIFLNNGAYLLVKSILYGNILALLIIGIQYFTHIIPMNPDVYYTDAVPVIFSYRDYIWINFGTFFVSMFSLLLPSVMISNITPAKTIKFE